MFSIHLLESNVSLDELLKLKLSSNAYFIVISSEYVCVPRFVEYAFLQAFKTFENGQNTAKTLNLEWLCNLALTKNVSNAVNFTKPSGKEICLASVNCFETQAELKKIGAKIKLSEVLRQKVEKNLVKKYEISAKALEVYKLEDLLIEKAAVENL